MMMMVMINLSMFPVITAYFKQFMFIICRGVSFDGVAQFKRFLYSIFLFSFFVSIVKEFRLISGDIYKLI